ncbi:hypothetical protein [Variovorax terrae]|uniref:Uncharacterized protein n=1 Tax=Variovorax terrae TaxID=2923278 RepID=A0A9X1VXB0_9BURK|nr:hypothetical protein [Variovorax terrae]MCJ0765521.1 hypothetical protein [Variovorax terrae]
MFNLLTQVTRLIPTTRPVTAADGVARNLMERAEARAGLSPYQAEELRLAARAYLSVVR